MSQNNQPILENLVKVSFDIAQAKRDEYVTVDHLAMALLQNDAIIRVLEKLSVKAQDIVDTMEDYWNRTEVISLARQTNSGIDAPIPTKRFDSVIQRSVAQAMGSGKRVVEAHHVMATVLQEPVDKSLAVNALESRGVDRKAFLEALVRDLEKNKTVIDPATGSVKTQNTSALDQYAVNLNKRAEEGKIDPIIGRKYELDRTIQILRRRRKNNVIYVGDAGTGKTVLAEGLALMISQGNVPDQLKKARVYALDLGALMAGTKYRGDMEERLKDILKELNELRDEEHIQPILFIDEIHTMIGAGQVSGGSMDVSNLLKPALARGELSCIGSTTYDEYEKHFAKDSALRRRFQKLDISEPTVLETIDILNGLKDAYEKHHGVTYTPDAIVAAAELTSKYQQQLRLPDKAIDIIDEAGAQASLSTDPNKVIDENKIREILSLIIKVPIAATSAEEVDSLKNLVPNLQLSVFGQDHAIEKLAEAVLVSRAGLREEDKPAGAYVFTGPTGTGKTEVCKRLAETLGIPFVKFDMSEYMEKHSLSQLIGAPPGYVGHDDSQGKLIEAIDRAPTCVLLLDEIEKAHPDLYNILLQILDGAKLTSTKGKTVSFKNVIVIMTTNAGSADSEKFTPGFGSKGARGASEIDEATKKLFTPELRNRLDEIIAFNRLTPDVIVKVVNKFIAQLQVFLDPKSVVLKVTDEALDKFASDGFDEKFGARPMARLIDRVIKRPIAPELLFGELVHGGQVIVDVKDGEFDISYKPLASAQPDVLLLTNEHTD